MKFSVSSYSFGWYGNEEKLGYLGVIDKAAEMGFEGIEFVEGYWQNTTDGAKQIKERCAEKGLETVAFAVGADFLNGSGGNIKDEIKRVQNLVDVAAEVGFKALRHDVIYGVYGKKYQRGFDDVLPVIAEGCREVTKYAEQKGIKTMTENHGFFSQDANRVEKLINAVAHPNFGALVDIGNFMCADEYPPISVGILAPYAFHVHAKDFHFKKGTEVKPGTGWFCSRGGNYLRGAIIGHGDAGVYQSIHVLKRSKYDGFMSIEFEGMEDNLYGIQIGLENLKRFCEN